MLTNNNFVVSLSLSLSLSPVRSSGNGQHSSAASRFNLVQVKQEPLEAPTHDSMQEHSLDLSKKDSRYDEQLSPWGIQTLC